MITQDKAAVTQETLMRYSATFDAENGTIKVYSHIQTECTINYKAKGEHKTFTHESLQHGEVNISTNSKGAARERQRDGKINKLRKKTHKQTYAEREQNVLRTFKLCHLNTNFRT